MKYVTLSAISKVLFPRNEVEMCLRSDQKTVENALKLTILNKFIDSGT